uniref:(northern house mosquito) hypothetical protein n=1 Tax=Culex pipiens TaxID=7175 RepID=A0A8D8G4P0_CULPI
MRGRLCQHLDPLPKVPVLHVLQRGMSRAELEALPSVRVRRGDQAVRRVANLENGSRQNVLLRLNPIRGQSTGHDGLLCARGHHRGQSPSTRLQQSQPFGCVQSLSQHQTVP